MTLSDLAKYSMIRSARGLSATAEFLVSYPLHSTPLLGGPRRNIAIPFDVIKLE